MGEVALRMGPRPSVQRGGGIECGHLLQPVGEQGGFEKAAEQRDDGAQLRLFLRFDGAGGAAWLQRQAVRPLAGEDACEMQEGGARGQHVARGGAGLRLEARGGGRKVRTIGVFSAGEVRHEEQVEVGEVVAEVLAGQHQVGGQRTVVGLCHAHRGPQRGGGGHRLRHRADAADARGIDQGVARILAVQDLLEAAVQRRVDPGGGYRAVGDLHLHLEVALDAVERTEDASGHARDSSVVLAIMRMSLAPLDRGAHLDVVGHRVLA